MNEKPATQKIDHAPLQTFSVREPVDQVEVTRDGKKVKEWIYKTYHFTTSDEPVTYRGTQYIPLSMFDRVRWEAIAK